MIRILYIRIDSLLQVVIMESLVLYVDGIIANGWSIYYEIKNKLEINQIICNKYLHYKGLLCMNSQYSL